MFCPHCGAEMPEENPKFCLKCGAPLTKEAVQESTQASEPAPQPEPQPEPVAQTESPSASQVPTAVEPGQKNALLAKLGPNGKLIAIVAAIVLVAVVVTALVVSSCNKPTETPAPEPTAEPEPEPEPKPDPDDDLTVEEKREFFVGTWVAQDSTDPSMSKEWFEQNAAQGLYITLHLWDDGTGAFRTDKGPVKFTWEAESATKATADIDDNDITLVLRGKNLTMKNADDVEIHFVTEEEADVDLDNAVDLSWQGMGVTVDPSTIQVGEYSKLIGNEYVGYMAIPEHWVNRIDDIDPEWAKDNGAVYYVDPGKEFLSPSKGHYDFELSVQMSRHAESYTSLAQRLVDAYKSDEKYGDAASTYAAIGKRRAIVIMSTNKEDGINVMSIVIDRDNNEKCSVVLSFNCGTTSDSGPTEWCLAYARTWQVE